MKKARVYFAPFSESPSLEVLAERTSELAEAAFQDVVVEGQTCAIKQHFGEGRGVGYIKPPVTRAVVDYVKRTGGKPFVTDTNTLYRGRRSNSVDHLLQARDHGFTVESLEAPVIIADGLLGADQVTVPIAGGKHSKAVRIAAAAYHAASAIVLTHVTGHCAVGYGGGIKNVGMGFAARAGKLDQHFGDHPIFNHEKCVACGLCVKWCPTNSIMMKEKATLLPEKCIGCGECLALCPHDAIGFEWAISAAALSEKICEHALGFLLTKNGHVGHINFLMDLTKDCDCFDKKQTAQYPNVGVFASTDLVAVEKATVDVACERYGKDVWLEMWPESGYRVQFEYGEKLGLGTTRYELVEIR